MEKVVVVVVVVAGPRAKGFIRCVYKGAPSICVLWRRMYSGKQRESEVKYKHCGFTDSWIDTTATKLSFRLAFGSIL